ncbi:hypothetical protein COCOBI_16-0260 [Coccomyxa sp. Obi]|nr:hypothetical protein COCOBI_16-0260 [Coccomyxa sp. Obi]
MHVMPKVAACNEQPQISLGLNRNRNCADSLAGCNDYAPQHCLVFVEGRRTLHASGQSCQINAANKAGELWVSGCVSRQKTAGAPLDGTRLLSQTDQGSLLISISTGTMDGRESEFEIAAWIELPPDVWALIGSHLGARDLARASTVIKVLGGVQPLALNLAHTLTEMPQLQLLALKAYVLLPLLIMPRLRHLSIKLYGWGNFAFCPAMENIAALPALQTLYAETQDNLCATTRHKNKIEEMPGSITGAVAERASDSLTPP